MLRNPLFLLTLLALTLVLALTVSAESSYDEAVSGDLSDDRLAPTQLPLTIGQNRLSATTGPGDLDYFTVHLPAGSELHSLVLSDYDSDDPIAFAAIQAGTIFTEPASGTDVGNLLGWVHMGQIHEGSDILDDLGMGGGAIGFTPPLSGLSYSFWVQQIGANADYTLDFYVAPADTGTAYDEAVDGDLSGNRLAPTVIPLQVGGNDISASSVSGDVEYFSVQLGCGQQLSAILLSAYASDDGIAFIAVQEGTVFTEPPTDTDVTQLLGWHHFGTTFDTIGGDVLPKIGAGDGAIGFSPPLASGTYTFWSQQTGPLATDYTLTFVVEPNSAESCLFLPAVINQ